MKVCNTKKIFLVIFYIIIAMQLKAQTAANNEYYNRLYYLCKVWGFAKYFHTEIAEGNINWDNELLQAIQGVNNSNTNQNFNDSLQLMLNNAGTMEISDSTLPNVPDSLKYNLDLAWIQDTIFSNTVNSLLDTIRVRFRPQSNHYVSQAFPVGNPSFSNDKQYYSNTGSYPNEEYRLLALFRYWNIINYFYPYKYMMDQNWDSTLVEFISKFAEADNALLYHLTFKELTTRINDSHASFSSPSFESWVGFCYPPFQVSYIENEMIITKVLPEINEVNVGDIIKQIDGQNIYTLRDSLRRYVHGSNNAAIERNLNNIILWGDYDNFQIVVDNGITYDTVTLNRNNTNYSYLQSNNNPIWWDTTLIDGCNIGYVNMGKLKTHQIPDMFNDLWNTDAIVFDIRNYPNGTLWTLINYLYINPINIAAFTIPDITYPGTLYWTQAVIGSGTNNPYNGKVLILFNEETISQAEYTCMGLEQHPGAIKIGSQTAAADGNVSYAYLPGKIITYFTGLGTFYPDYTETQRVGIVPDIEVHPTIDGIREGRDEVLEVALNCSLIFGVNDIAYTPKMNIYPNPVVDKLNYWINSSKSCKLKIEIIDITGRVIKVIEKNLLLGTINLADLKKGMYLVRFSYNKKSISKKIIKE